MKVPLVPFNVPDYVQTQPTDACVATAGRFHICYSLAELEPEVLDELSETFRSSLFAKAGKVDPREELTCKTCEHYQPARHFPGTQACTSPKMLYGYLLKATEPDQVLIEDDEGWGMRPGPDFGCIHHKEKQQ